MTARLPEKCCECGQLIEYNDDSPIVIESFIMKPGFNTVEYNGQSIRFTPQEFETLRFIVKKAQVNQVARSMSIYTDVFERPDGTPEPKIVDVIVCKVRNKLNQIGGGGMIATLWGQGYQFDITNSSFPKTTGAIRKAYALKRKSGE